MRWIILSLVLIPTLWVLGSALEALPNAASQRPFIDDTGRGAFFSSLILGFTAAATAACVGLPYGWALARTTGRRGRALALGAVLPLLLPPYAIGLAWMLLLNRQGPVAALLSRWGLPSPTPLLGSPVAAGLILALAFWPIVAWFVRAGAGGTPVELEDAARLETTGRRAAWYAAWPSVGAALRDAVLLVCLLALADFGVANSLGVNALPREIVVRFAVNQDPGEAARLALPLLLVIVPLAWWNCRCLRLSPTAAAETSERPRTLRHAGSLLPVCSMIAIVGAVLPLATLAWFSLGPRSWAEVMVEAPKPLAGSAWLGVTTAILAVGVSFTLRRLPALPDLLVSLPYALPASLLAIAAIRILNHPGPLGDIYGTPAALLWVYVALFLPFAYRILAPAWPRVDQDLRDETALAGAGEWKQVRVVAWPTLAPYALLAAVVVFVLAGREMDATALLRPPGLETAAFRIHDYLHFYPVPNVAAFCLVLVALQLAGIGALWLASRWAKR